MAEDGKFVRNSAELVKTRKVSAKRSIAGKDKKMACNKSRQGGEKKPPKRSDKDEMYENMNAYATHNL